MKRFLKKSSLNCSCRIKRFYAFILRCATLKESCRVSCVIQEWRDTECVTRRIKSATVVQVYQIIVVEEIVESTFSTIISQ